MFIDRLKNSVVVDNRARKITEAKNLRLKSGKRYYWRYCPGDLNPADLLTRPVNAKTFLNSTSWRNGPEFLKKNSEDWPDEDNKNCVPADIEAEDKETASEISTEPLFEIGNYSNLEKALRVTA